MAITAKFFRDPFIQFLFLGSIVFFLFSFLSGGGDNNKIIVVSHADVARLEAQWTKQYSKPPTPEQTRAIVDQFIREEIFYREARSLDLGEDDIIVRRRMVQKYQFLSEDILQIDEPSEETLRVYFQANSERYITPQKTSFRHVYFKDNDSAKKVDQSRARTLAEQSLKRLNDGDVDSIAWRTEGHAFMLQREYAARDDKDVGELFGIKFSQSLSLLKVGGWAGPIQSAYGWHVVNVIARSEPRAQRMTDIRSDVLTDYLSSQRMKNNKEFYQKTKNAYQIIYENAELSPVPAGKL